MAQNKNTIFEHLTINEGLSSNRISCIFQDSKDYLWISTNLGLNRFDSDQIKKYIFDKNNDRTISDDNTRVIYEDSNGQLWFGTDNGLNLYDRSTDSFIRFMNDPADTTTINSNFINSITEDSYGNLWILTDYNCLNRWNPETGNFFRLRINDYTATTTLVTARMMAKDSNGNIWISSYEEGIYQLDPETEIVNHYSDPGFDFGDPCVKSLYIDADDIIWIASYGNGLFSYDPMNNVFVKIGKDGEGNSPKQLIIRDIIPDGNRFLLLAVDQGGLNRYDKLTGKFEYIEYDQTNPHGLNNNGIWCLHRDNEDILWVGTSGGGINYYNPKKEKFKLFSSSGNPNSLSYNSVMCFYEDHSGLIWIGTDGGGLNLFDPETEEFSVFRHDPSDPYSIGGNAILSIVEDKDYNIWVGTWDAGLNKYDRNTGKFYRYLPNNNPPYNVSGRNIWRLGVDHNNNIWVGVLGSGIDLFDPKKGIIDRFTADTTNISSLHGATIRMFYRDMENNMWACTNNGLSLYDTDNNSFINYNFPDNSITAFHKDKNGNFWIGSTSSGLYFCDSEGTILKTFTVEDGLADDQIRGITEGKEDELWITTANGISQFDINNATFRNYTNKNGLQANEFHQNSLLRTSREKIFMGGYNGFNTFHPDSLQDNSNPPSVYITDFQLFNKPVTYGGPEGQFKTHISEADEIELTWRQSVISFSFNAINYTFPENNLYAYYMDGFEKEWNYTDATRKYVTYTNLDPGHYTFRVKASNNDGVWNEEGVSLKVTILPPWWATFIFRLGMILLVVTLVYLSFRYRVRQLTRQKLHLKKSVSEKTAQLRESNAMLIERQNKIEEQKESLVLANNQLNNLNASKDKFFSIIAHDLRGPLSAFIGATEVLNEDLLSMEEDEILEFTYSMEKSAKNVYDLLENLLEWSQLIRGAMEFSPTSLNVKEITEECINILSQSANKKEIKIAVDIQDDTIVYADKHMLNGIMRNLISNAIKFTPSGGNITTKANTKYDNKIEISVSDSGIGIPDPLKDKLFILSEKTGRSGTDGEPSAGLGLMLCKEFVERHGGYIWVESTVNTGSTFKFLMPANQ